MSYLKRHGTRRVPQWRRCRARPRTRPAASPGRSIDLGAPAPLPDPRLGGRQLLRGRVDAHARERAGGRARASRADGPRAVAEIVRDQRRGPGAEERPGAVRARDGGRSRRRGDAPGGARGAAAGGRTGTHLFQFVHVRRGLPRLGPLAAPRGRRLVRGAARSTSLAYQAVKYRQREGVTHRDVLRLAHPAGRVGAGNPTLESERRARRLFEWIVRGGDTDGLPRAGRGLRARPGGGDAGARRRSSSASTACRARRSSRST